MDGGTEQLTEVCVRVAYYETLSFSVIWVTLSNRVTYCSARNACHI